MSTPSYLFYDIETTGLNPCFDQVLQFAAIRTDLALNEISRHEIRIKLNPDIIPAPMAVLTHQQSIEIMQQGVNEYDGIREIHALMNTPNTISLGYNTLGFDDEFLRFSFYRNLLPPYTHQFQSGCGRMDIYPMAILYYNFKPDCLTWPEIDGKISLRLENINNANQLASGMAHDAMVDVDVTVELAKRFYQDQRMWEFCCGYFNKQDDTRRLSQLTEGINVNGRHYPIAYLARGKNGAKNHFLAPALNLGQHQSYKNQTLWLRLDDPNLVELSAHNAAEKTYPIRRKTAENVIVLPPKPRFQQRLTTSQCEQSELSLAWLQQHPQVLTAIREHHCQYTYPAVPNLDPDAALYQLGFASATENQAMQAFHQAAPEDKAAAASLIRCPARQTLAHRIIAKHYPHCLPKQAETEFQAYLQHQFTAPETTVIDYRQQPKLNHVSALNEINALTDLPSASSELLTTLTDYIHAKGKALQQVDS